MSTASIPCRPAGKHPTTTSDIRRHVGALPPQFRNLDADSAQRLALAYLLVLYRLLPVRHLMPRLLDIGLTPDAAADAVRVAATIDLGGDV